MPLSCTIASCFVTHAPRHMPQCSADVLGVKKGVTQLKRVNANYPKRQMSLHGGV